MKIQSTSQEILKYIRKENATYCDIMLSAIVHNFIHAYQCCTTIRGTEHISCQCRKRVPISF